MPADVERLKAAVRRLCLGQIEGEDIRMVEEALSLFGDQSHESWVEADRDDSIHATPYGSCIIQFGFAGRHLLVRRYWIDFAFRPQCTTIEYCDLRSYGGQTNWSRLAELMALHCAVHNGDVSKYQQEIAFQICAAAREIAGFSYSKPGVRS